LAGHVWYTSGDGHSCSEWGECNLCVLSVCKVCGLLEGSLTTDCPGENSMKRSDEIYTSKLDYRESEGGWVNKFSPSVKSIIQGAIFDLLKGHSEKSEAKLIVEFGATKEEWGEIKSECLSFIDSYPKREAARLKELENKRKVEKRRHLTLMN
jgi:hypothetical protein